MANTEILYEYDILSFRQKSDIPPNDNCSKYIQDYIQTWNKETPLISKPLWNARIDVRIIYHHCRDLYNGNDYYFGQDLYATTKTKNDTKQLYPTIHLTLYNIFDNKNTLSLSVKRHKKIIDSSIWNYHVPIEINDGKIDYKHFNNVLREIEHNYEKGLYNLSVAYEYVNLNARLLKQSYLNGSHESISPFLFHSEYEMYKLIHEHDSHKKGINLEDIRSYKWRFLLLDDKCIEPMKGTAQKEPNKLQIIADNLKLLGFTDDVIWFRTGFKDDSNGKSFAPQYYGKVMDGKWDVRNAPNSTEEMSVVIDCVEKVEDALECMKHYKYEIILLDYLLNGKYGYELLEELRKWHRNREEDKKNTKDSQEPTYRIGPNRRCIFFFISAFTTAVHERLLESGMNKAERKLWYIGDGACPTNTPYLFSYQLFLQMRHRLTDLKKEDEDEKLSLIDLMEDIFLNKEENDVRMNAHKHFKHILYMRSKYYKLENDLSYEDEHLFEADRIMQMESSLLIHSAFHFIHHFSGAFFEHLQHLVYLVAYGTIRQWTELWEEYVFIQHTFSEYDTLINKKLNTNDKRGMAINNAIREYIINLKENCN